MIFPCFPLFPCFPCFPLLKENSHRGTEDTEGFTEEEVKGVFKEFYRIDNAVSPRQHELNKLDNVYRNSGNNRKKEKLPTRV